MDGVLLSLEHLQHETKTSFTAGPSLVRRRPSTCPNQSGSRHAPMFCRRPLPENAMKLSSNWCDCTITSQTELQMRKARVLRSQSSLIWPSMVNTNQGSG